MLKFVGRACGLSRLIAGTFAGLVAIGILPMSNSQAASPPARYYLSLGDSLAGGTQPGPDGKDQPSSQGYVDVVGSYLRHLYPGLKLIRLGGIGTSRTLISGAPVDPSYGSESQLEQAIDFLKSHRTETVSITVNIGDNDVENCITPRRIRWGCVKANLAAVSKNLPTISSRLRAAAGSIPIVGISDYDQFWGFWLDGPRGQRIALRAARIVQRLNATIDRAWKASGALVADASYQFHTVDKRLVRVKALGVVPRAVERVCELTWACSGPPIGFNPHANARGYRVIGNAVIDALAAIAPSGASLS